MTIWIFRFGEKEEEEKKYDKSNTNYIRVFVCVYIVGLLVRLFCACVPCFTMMFPSHSLSLPILYYSVSL